MSDPSPRASGAAGVTAPAGTGQSPYVVIGRERWSTLRDTTPLTLDDDDLERLRGLGDTIGRRWVLVAAGCSSGEPVAEEPADRLLVVSMPGVSWHDVHDGSLPNLARFVEHAAVGNLATRIGRREATATSHPRVVARSG